MKTPEFVKVHSKTNAVRAWCKENPGDSLSTTDMQTKFGISRAQAMGIVKKLRREGLFHPQIVYLATRPAANDEGKEAA